MYKNINVKILRGLKKISESKCGKIKRKNKRFFYFNYLFLFLFAHFFKSYSFPDLFFLWHAYDSTLNQLCNWVIEKESGKSFYSTKLVAQGEVVKPSASCSILWVLQNSSMQIFILFDGIHDDCSAQDKPKTIATCPSLPPVLTRQHPKWAFHCRNMYIRGVTQSYYPVCTVSTDIQTTITFDHLLWHWNMNLMIMKQGLKSYRVFFILFLNWF